MLLILLRFLSSLCSPLTAPPLALSRPPVPVPPVVSLLTRHQLPAPSTTTSSAAAVPTHGSSPPPRSSQGHRVGMQKRCLTRSVKKAPIGPPSAIPSTCYAVGTYGDASPERPRIGDEAAPAVVGAHAGTKQGKYSEAMPQMLENSRSTYSVSPAALLAPPSAADALLATSSAG
jgi:hypothetical protein